MTTVYRTGTGLYRQALVDFPPSVGGFTTADGRGFRAATGALPDSAVADSAGELGPRL
jgi:hypothetical protein